MNEPMKLASLVAGKKVEGSELLEVRHPYNQQLVGTVRTVTSEDIERALNLASGPQPKLTRFERSQILERTREKLEKERESFARIITSESGLCLHETRYEVGRTLDVLKFAAMEALRDDGEAFA